MDISDYLEALAGPAIQFGANKLAANRMNTINNAATAYKTAQSGIALDATGKLIANTMTPTAIAANDASAKATLADNLNKTIAASRSYEANPNYGGKVTSDYTGRVASDAGTVGSRIARSVNDLSTIGAPAIRQQNDASQFATAANTVAGANSAANTVGAAYNQAIGTVRPNPLLTFGAQLANGLNAARKVAPATLPLGLQTMGTTTYGDD